jgi:hypothetical protein
MTAQATTPTARDIATAEALALSSSADAARWARIAATRPLTARERTMQRNAQDQSIQDRSLVEALKEAQATARRQATIQAASLACGHQAADLLSGACQGAGCQGAFQVGSRVSPATDPARFGTITQVMSDTFVFVRWDDCCPCGGTNADPRRLIPAYNGPRCANCAAPVPGPWNATYLPTGARTRLCPACQGRDACCYAAL